MRQVVASPVKAQDRSESPFVVQWMWRFVTSAATDWRWSPSMVLVVGLLPFVIAFGGAATAGLGKGAFKWFVQEDGVAESIQVLLYLSCSLLAVFVTYRQWRSGNRIMAFLYTIFCLGLFFLTGEEVSWGQRIWGWETSAAMAAVNQQNETNFHNLRGVQDIFRWVQLLVGAYGAVLPLAIFSWLKSDQLRNLAWQLVPHPLLIPYFGLMFVWKLYRNLGPELDQFQYFLAKYNEVVELALALGFLFFLVYQIRRKQRITAA